MPLVSDGGVSNEMLLWLLNYSLSLVLDILIWLINGLLSMLNAGHIVLPDLVTSWVSIVWSTDEVCVDHLDVLLAVGVDGIVGVNPNAVLVVGLNSLAFTKSAGKRVAVDIGLLIVVPSILLVVSRIPSKSAPRLRFPDGILLVIIGA